MRTIHKFPVEVLARQIVSVPGGIHVISAGLNPHDNGQVCIWVQVETEASHVTDFCIAVCGTGQPIPWSGDEIPHHKGTVIQGPFAWHVFHIS